MRMGWKMGWTVRRPRKPLKLLGFRMIVLTFCKIVHFRMSEKRKIVYDAYIKKCKIGKGNVGKIEKTAFLCYSIYGGTNYV